MHACNVYNPAFKINIIEEECCLVRLCHMTLMLLHLAFFALDMHGIVDTAFQM